MSDTDRKPSALPWQALVAAVAVLSSSMATAAELVRYEVARETGEVADERLVAQGEQLRLDDGRDDGDYVLFDAAGSTARVVTHGSRSVLVIRGVDTTHVQSPMALDRAAVAAPSDPRAPRIAGVRPTTVSLSVNGRSCAELAVLPESLSGLRRLWAGYARLMAAHHREILPSIPADLHEPCDLALNLFDGAWWLEHGLPVIVTGEALPSRRLAGFDADYRAAPGLFSVPTGYTVRELSSVAR